MTDDYQLPSKKLKEKCRRLVIEVVAQDPYVGKKLVGELRGSYSLRLSYQDRIVYSINEEKKIVYIERA